MSHIDPVFRQAKFNRSSGRAKQSATIGNQPHQNHISFIFCAHKFEIPQIRFRLENGHWCFRPAIVITGFKINFCSFCQRKKLCIVTQQDNGFPHSQISFFLEFGISHNLCGRFRIDIWIFEQSQKEFFTEKPCNRFINSLFRNHSLFYRFKQNSRIGISREDIDTSVDCFLVALRNCQIFNTPGHHVNRTSIRVDDSFKSQFAAQCIGNNGFIVRIANFFELRAGWP